MIIFTFTPLKKVIAFIVDDSGNLVSGKVVVNYVGTSQTETLDVPLSGVLLIKQIVNINDIIVD